MAEGRKVKLRILRPMIDPRYFVNVPDPDIGEINKMLSVEKNKKSGITRGSMSYIMNHPDYMWGVGQIVEVDQELANDILKRKFKGFNKRIGELKLGNYTEEEMERPVEAYAELVK